MSLLASSLVSECLMAVSNATSLADLGTLATLYQMKTSAFAALSKSDQDAVRAAWAARRTAIRTVATVVAMVAPIEVSQASQIEIGAPVAPVATTIEAALTAVAAETPAVVARRTRTVRASQSSAQAVATATRVARQAGSRLAGYDGRIVDPGQGLGTIIAFGNAEQEMDLVSGRMRQKLVRWVDVVAALTSIGLPADTLGDPVTRVAHLGQASKILNHSGWLARNARNLGKFRSSWILGRVDLSIDSDTLGDRECRLDLQADGTVTSTDPTHAAAIAVIREYDARVASTLIESSDLRARIERVLVNDYGARNTDLGLYCSPYHAARALDLIVALRPVSARRIHAWSHTDRESISDALCDSFAADLVRLETAVASKDGAIKVRGTSAVLEKCERLRAECDGLASILGTEAVEGYRVRLAALDAAIVEGMDGTSQRFANLELS